MKVYVVKLEYMFNDCEYKDGQVFTSYLKAQEFVDKHCLTDNGIEVYRILERDLND